MDHRKEDREWKENVIDGLVNMISPGQSYEERKETLRKALYNKLSCGEVDDLWLAICDFSQRQEIKWRRCYLREE